MPAEISRQAAKLAAYYRRHREAPIVGDVEGHLTNEWQSTSTIAERSHRSRHYITLTLEYLYSEGRAERRRFQTGTTAWRWEWRRAEPSRTTYSAL